MDSAHTMHVLTALATKPVQDLITHTVEHLTGAPFVAPGWPVCERGEFPLFNGVGQRVGDIFLELAGMEKKDVPVAPQAIDVLSAAVKFATAPLLRAAGLEHQYRLQVEGTSYYLDAAAPLRLWATTRNHQ